MDFDLRMYCVLWYWSPVAISLYPTAPDSVRQLDLVDFATVEVAMVFDPALDLVALELDLVAKG
jgi:hypothetical protein